MLVIVVHTPSITGVVCVALDQAEAQVGNEGPRPLRPRYVCLCMHAWICLCVCVCTWTCVLRRHTVYYITNSKVRFSVLHCKIEQFYSIKYELHPLMLSCVGHWMGTLSVWVEWVVRGDCWIRGRGLGGGSTLLPQSLTGGQPPQVRLLYLHTCNHLGYSQLYCTCMYMYNDMCVIEETFCGST